MVVALCQEKSPVSWKDFLSRVLQDRYSAVYLLGLFAGVNSSHSGSLLPSNQEIVGSTRESELALDGIGYVCNAEHRCPCIIT